MAVHPEVAVVHQEAVILLPQDLVAEVAVILHLPDRQEVLLHSAGVPEEVVVAEARVAEAGAQDQAVASQVAADQELHRSVNFLLLF